MVEITPIIGIFGITAILVIVSRLMQNRFMDRDLMDEQRKEMNEKRDRMKELLSKQDEKSLKEAEKIQREMLEMSQKMMQGSMRYMMVSLPLFLGVFFLMGFVYGETIIDLPVPLPWWENAEIFNPFTWLNIKFFEQTNWFGWYFASYLFISILYGIGRRILKRIKGEQK